MSQNEGLKLILPPTYWWLEMMKSHRYSTPAAIEYILRLANSLREGWAVVQNRSIGRVRLCRSTPSVADVGPVLFFIYSLMTPSPFFPCSRHHCRVHRYVDVKSRYFGTPLGNIQLDDSRASVLRGFDTFFQFQQFRIPMTFLELSI